MFTKIFYSETEAINFSTIVNGNIIVYYDWDGFSHSIIKEFLVKF